MDNVSAAAAMFYDSAAFQYSVLNHGGGSGAGAGGCLVFDEGYNNVGEVSEKMGSKRRKKGVEEGSGGHKNEKQRRERLSKKYDVLKALIPNPTKVLYYFLLPRVSLFLDYLFIFQISR